MLNFDHIVLVVMENHSYQEIMEGDGAQYAPYINSVLAKDGISINNAYGEQHPSQPNYFWLFSGSNQGIEDDHSYWEPNNPGPVFSTPNLYTALEERFASINPNFFHGYVDGIQDNSSSNNYYNSTGNYANRHVPWLGFKNINNGDPAAATVTKIFDTDFPGANGEVADFDSLPIVSMVIPGLNHDMHDYGSETSEYVNSVVDSQKAVHKGDKWLEKHINPYAQWAKDNNSLLIITWDEDSSSDWITPVELGGGGTFKNAEGLTAPNLQANQAKKGTSGPNQIPMFFYGANLATSGGYSIPGTGANNINLLRTIEAIYGLSASGEQSSVAKEGGLDDLAIPGLFNFSY